MSNFILARVSLSGPDLELVLQAIYAAVQDKIETAVKVTEGQPMDQVVSGDDMVLIRALATEAYRLLQIASGLDPDKRAVHDSARSKIQEMLE